MKAYGIGNKQLITYGHGHFEEIKNVNAEHPIFLSPEKAGAWLEEHKDFSYGLTVVEMELIE